MFTQVSKISFRAILLILSANLRNSMNIYQTFFSKMLRKFVRLTFVQIRFFLFVILYFDERELHSFSRKWAEDLFKFRNTNVLEKRGWTLSKASVTTQKQQFVLDKVQIGTLHMLYDFVTNRCSTHIPHQYTVNACKKNNF